MNQLSTIHALGESLPLGRLLELATIRTSDIEEMKARSHPSIKPFLNATIRSQKP